MSDSPQTLLPVKKNGNSFPTLDFPFPFPCVAVAAVSLLRKEHEVLPLYFTLD